MTMAEIIQSQITDPFRIALLAGLVLTMFRTRANTGTLLPLAAGLVFVAAIIPTTLGAQSGESFWQLFGFGLLSNALIVAVLMALATLVRRIRS